MSDKDLTDWFPGHVKPVRHGVYQRLYAEGTEDECPEYCLFDGAWHMFESTIERAVSEKHLSALQNLKWRGLLKP